MEVNPVFSVQDQIRDRDIYPQIQLWVNGRKMCSPGVLTIYIGDAKILIGKSNGSRHSVWGASENMSCDLRGWNFSTLFNLFI